MRRDERGERKTKTHEVGARGEKRRGRCRAESAPPRMTAVKTSRDGRNDFGRCKPSAPVRASNRHTSESTAHETSRNAGRMRCRISFRCEPERRPGWKQRGSRCWRRCCSRSVWAPRRRRSRSWTPPRRLHAVRRPARRCFELSGIRNALRRDAMQGASPAASELALRGAEDAD